MKRPERLLKDVASELYHRVKERQPLLLQYLRAGDLAACVKLPLPGLAPTPINPEVWLPLKVSEFRVRWKSNGHWRTRTFCIDARSVIGGISMHLQELILALNSASINAKDLSEAQLEELRSWLLNGAELRYYEARDWANLARVLVARLAEIVALTHVPAPVYVTADEWDRFFDQIGSRPKGPGGRKQLEGDAFWIEFIALLSPTKPIGSQKTLIHELRTRLEKSKQSPPSPSWARNRIQDLYGRMGWNNTTTTTKTE